MSLAIEVSIFDLETMLPYFGRGEKRREKNYWLVGLDGW
jgi:hypothetical protein